MGERESERGVKKRRREGEKEGRGKGEGGKWK